MPVNSTVTLKKNREFQHVYRNGKSMSSRIMVLVFSRAKRGSLRIGFSVSKKVGNSVVRNRVKRRMRECFRQNMPEVIAGHNLIFIARGDIVAASYQQIEKSMRLLLEKSHLLLAP